MLMIRRAKGLELMKIIFITNLSTFGLNMLLTLKIMDFENVALCLYLCKREHECIIYNIKSNCSQNVFISNMKC
jgi:hypothetical protein